MHDGSRSSRQYLLTYMFAFATALSKVHENFRHRAHAPLVMKEGKEKGPNLEICKQYNKLARCSDLCVCTELLFTLRPAGGRAGGRVADVAARTSEAPSASCLSPTSSVQFWFQQLERRSA